MGRSTAVVAVLALALAVPAVAAMYVCHPDPAGTRALQLHGRVIGYRVRGSTATIALRDGARCTTMTWSTRGVRHSTACAHVRTALAAPAGVRVVHPAGVDRPDRLVVSASGRSWPLPVRARPQTLQVAGDLAAYEARGGRGLWVTRLTDGRTTFVGPVKAGVPVLTADGAFYVDNVYKMAPSDRPVAKFVPTYAIQGELSRVGLPVRTGGAIRAFSMDGTRMALVVAGAGCDRVVFWDVPWRSVEQVSQQAGVTCAASGASGRISQIALGGTRAQWVTTQHGKPVVVAADDIGCQEWVVGRLQAPMHLSLAADGTMHAFTLPGRVADILGNYRSSGLYGSEHVQALAADGNLTAALARERVTIHQARLPELSFVARGADSLGLRGRTVVTTTAAGRLNVYRSGRLAHSWRLPAGTRPGVDVQYGIAVVTTRDGVYGIDTANGRTALLASTPTPPRAQIESIGVGYVYSVGNRGTAAVVPMSTVEAVLGR